jgi:diguanylate cyclase (GGDEF)-like protein/putative nucleotidyltransferase with HDIG domain
MITCGLLTLAFVAFYIALSWGPPWLRSLEKFRYYAFDILYILPPTLGFVTGVVYMRRVPRSANGYNGWVLLGLACLFFALGHSIWAYYELLANFETPFPSWADAAFLFAEVLLIIGVFVLFGTMPIVGRLRLLLDSAIAVISVGAFSWYILIERLWAQSNTSLPAKLIGIAYPMADVVALYSACVIYLGTREHSTVRRSVACVVAGIISIAVADFAFSFATLNSTYLTGTWTNFGWMLGCMLIANAIRLQTVRHSSTEVETGNEYSNLPQQSVTVWRLLGPYLAAASAIFAIAFYDFENNGTIALSILGWGLSLLVLVALRQVFTLLENQQLTQQFAMLLEYTKELNDVLDVEHVLQVTARYTQKLTGAHSAAAWVVKKDRNAHERRNVTRGVVEGAELYVETGFSPCFAQLQALAAAQSSTRSASVQSLGSLANSSSNRCYMMPLSGRHETLGAIAVARLTGSFSQPQLMVLESIALEASTAVSNALSYRKALEDADRDPVTGLFNHRAIHERLQTEWERSVRKDLTLSVIMLDLNDFKFFNDTYGHPIGDQVLQTVARVLRESSRSNDLVARYGGDEFALVLPETDAENARIIAQRIKTRMDSEGFHFAGNTSTLPVGLSLGVATFPQDGRTRSELLAAADVNLYSAKLHKESICVTREVQRNHELRTDDSYSFLDCLVTAVDNKDSYTRRHSEDVTEYSLWIAEELKLSQETMRVIRIGGLLHDVGKIGVPDEILRKPGKLSEDEFEIIKQHPLTGALIVAGAPGMQFIGDIVRSHHERWDGKGYPDGLSGENIPLLGRIVAVADAFSAMTTTRPYRRGMEWEVALQEVETQSGRQFDPKIANLFLQVARKRLTQPVENLSESSGETLHKLLHKVGFLHFSRVSL